jgi:hypothetical protein
MTTWHNSFLVPCCKEVRTVSDSHLRPGDSQHKLNSTVGSHRSRDEKVGVCAAMKLISNSTVEDPRYKLLFPSQVISKYSKALRLHKRSQHLTIPTPRNVSDPETSSTLPTLWNSKKLPKGGAASDRKEKWRLDGLERLRKTPQKPQREPLGTITHTLVRSHQGINRPPISIVKPLRQPWGLT